METYDSLPFDSNNSLLANSDPILTTAVGSGGLLFGGINNDILTPTTFNLVFTGAGVDTVEAGAESGDNRIYTGSGGDLLNAGNNDRLLGGAGNDTLDAGEGENNRLYAGAGNDRLLAGNGGNFLVGGVGNDEFWLAENNLPQSRNTIVDFEDEIDRLVIADVAEVTTFADLTLTDTEDGVVIKVGEDEIALLLGINSSNLTSSDFRFSAAIPSSLPVEISPTNGEEMVNLTRETIVRFPETINPTSVNSESFYLIANGTH